MFSIFKRKESIKKKFQKEFCVKFCDKDGNPEFMCTSKWESPNSVEDVWKWFENNYNKMERVYELQALVDYMKKAEPNISSVKYYLEERIRGLETEIKD